MIDSGVNYFDTASGYGEGKSETYMGPVVRARRDEMFVATKIVKRTQKDSTQEFEGSLQRLQSDYVDLLQLHAINSMTELDQVLGPGGALHTALEAQKAGKTRFVGITGHTRPDVLIAALKRHPFDTVLMPLGIGDSMLKNFADTVVPLAREQGIGTIGMKLLGMGQYISSISQSDCFRYSLNLPISVGIVGMNTRQQFREDLQAMTDLRPLSERELAELQDRARRFATTQTLWWKKEA